MRFFFHLESPVKIITHSPLSRILSFKPFSLAALANHPSPIPISPLAETSFNPTELADSFKEWFKRGSASPLSALDRLYQVLASTAYGDDRSLDAALTALSLPLKEQFVIRALHHRPHPSLLPEPGNVLLLLRLKFFDWSGRQPGYRHTSPAYHAVFRLLSRARLVSVVLDWLRVFETRPAAAGNRPELNETLIIGYAAAGRPDLALDLLAKMRFRGLDLQPFSYHVLLNSLVEASEFEAVSEILRHVYSRGLANAVTHCIRVKSLCHQNKLDEAHAFLSELAESSPSLFRLQLIDRAVGTLVQAFCARQRFKDAGRLVDVLGTSHSYGVWVAELISAGRLDVAMEFLDSRKKAENYVPESFHYNKLIFQLLKRNKLSEVYDLLVEMREEGISPDRATMNAVLCFFCKAGMVDVAIKLYNSRLELGIMLDTLMYNCFISALCREGRIDELCQVLEASIRQGYFPGGQTFNIVANALCREDRLKDMQTLLEIAHTRGFKPFSGVLARYVALLCKAGKADEACLLPQMATLGSSVLRRYKSAYTSLIKAFMVVKQVDVLAQLVINMQEQGHSLSRRLYVEVVCCLCETGMLDKVLELLNRQLQFKEPDTRTCYHYFIAGAAHAKNPEFAKELTYMMKSAGVKTSTDINILILKSYLKSGKISDALTFFRSLCETGDPRTKLYNVFITGLCEAGKPELAVPFWKIAREKGLIPNLNCYESLVHSLCSAKDYDGVVRVLEDFRLTGRRASSFLCNVLLLHTLKSQDLLHSWVQLLDGVDNSNSEAVREGASGTLFLGNLVAAFSRGIRLKRDLENLDEFVGKFFEVDIFTYNILIRGFAMARRMDLACILFYKIYKKGYEPNRWSFDSIVHGFCKLGRRKDAERWMEEMNRNGFHPTWYTMRLYNNTN